MGFSNTYNDNPKSEGRQLAKQAMKLWKKLQPELWGKETANAFPITSERTNRANHHNNASGSTQKAG